MGIIGELVELKEGRLWKHFMPGRGAPAGRVGKALSKDTPFLAMHHQRWQSTPHFWRIGKSTPEDMSNCNRAHSGQCPQVCLLRQAASWPQSAVFYGYRPASPSGKSISLLEYRYRDPPSRTAQDPVRVKLITVLQKP